MTVKVLVTAIGQQIVTTAKQIENKETGDLVGYWLSNPRVVGYTPNEDDKGLSVNFAPYCLVSDESEFSIRSEHIVSILEPRADVVEAYLKLVEPEEISAVIEGTEDVAIDPDVVEGSDVPDLADGTVGDGAESSPS